MTDLPILALVFDLAPGLNWVPLVPTVMHLLAIIMGVASTAPAAPIVIRSPGAE